MANEVSFKIKIDDDGTARKVSVDIDEVAKAINGVKDASEKLNKDKLNFAVLAQSIDSVIGAFNTLQSKFDELSGAYARQIEAETKLAQVMQNTMGATEADVQAIQELCAAQQELGVIGDEVQLAGAQELATYLEKRSSLEALIPVMNDMVAQQYGFNSTQESAASIATMLGKVMEGQTSALSRYGYSFTEAQEQVLKFGTEEERAAVLAEVVSASVGGVNEALAQTDYGKIVQMNNSWGDIQETIGKATTALQPWLSKVSALAEGAGAVVKLKQGFDLLKPAIASVGGGIKTLSAAIKAFCVSNPLLAVLTALAAAATALYYALSDDGGAAERLAEQTEAYNNAAASANSEMNQQISKLGSLIESHGDEAKAVEELNAKYGDIFGTYQTAAEWYNVLISKSKEYAKQKAYEAQAVTINNQLGQKQVELDKLKEKAKKMEEDAAASGTDLNGSVWLGSNIENAQRRAYQKLQEEINETTAAVVVLDLQYKKAMKSANDLAGDLKGGLSTTATNSDTDKDNGEGGNGTQERIAAAGSIAAIDAKLKTLKVEYDFATTDKDRQQIEAEMKRLEGEKFKLKIGIDAFSELGNGSGSAIAGLGIGNMLEPGKLSLTGSLGDTSNIAADYTANATREVEKFNEALKELENRPKNVQNTLSSLAGSFSTLGEAIGGTAGEVAAWASQTLAAIAEVIPQIIALNTANQAAAMGEATKAGAGVPFPANLIAIAAGVAAVVASFAAMPKFAAGGIAYGPTMGLFGEYPGAANNPEVVAPLSRLRSLLGTDNQQGGKVEFKIQGRQLVGVLARENNIVKRR